MDDFFLEMQQKGLIEFKKPQTNYEKLYSGTKNFAVKIAPTDQQLNVDIGEKLFYGKEN